MSSYLAWITPVSGGGAPGVPTHPIAPGGPPPVAGWPPVAMPPIYYPPSGGQPPGIWGGVPP
jgi:hypothetical protein